MSAFIEPMRARQEKDARFSLDSPDLIAEPKLNGERVQVHVECRRVTYIFSSSGRDITAQAGHDAIRAASWPISKGVLDGETFAGSGELVGDSVSTARAKKIGRVRFGFFDLLCLDGSSVMERPLSERRALLHQPFLASPMADVFMVPFSTSWQTMWADWVTARKGEGVMVKRLSSLYVPGLRSPDWVKVKVQRTVDVVITGVTTKATYSSGGYRTGEAALTYGYFQPASGTFETVGQGVRVGSLAEMEAHVGKVAELRCAAVETTGALRHHHFLRFRFDKLPEQCTREDA
jgi:ATP-dependent DNA ligase